MNTPVDKIAGGANASAGAQEGEIVQLVIACNWKDLGSWVLGFGRYVCLGSVREKERKSIFAA